MPPSRQFAFPTTHPSFLRHRFDAESPRFALNLNLSKPIPSPAWASLPTPPMSGTPPPEVTSDPSQLAGRRRKREDTPPSTTDVQRITMTTTVDTYASPLIEQTARGYADQPLYGRIPEPTMRPTGLSSPWEPQMPYAPGPSIMTIPPYGGGSVPIGQTQISPRATRKTKAHVASACVNCKKKHLRCDETRPCRRCVQSGKEDTCRDVEHKKRGRPPLKPDDPSSARHSRTNSLWSGVAFSAGRTLGNPSIAGSGYPPLLPQPTPRPTSMFGFPPYAAPTIAQSSATAMGQFSHSRHSSYSSLPTGPSFTIPPSFASQYPYAPLGQSMMPSTQQPSYGGSLFPRTFNNHSQQPQQQQQPSPQPSHMPTQLPNTSYYDTTNLQLPPILPVATTQSVHQSESSNLGLPPQQLTSYLSPTVQNIQQLSNQSLPPPPPQQQTQPRTVSRSSQERDSKRPRMDIGDVLHPRQD